MTEPIGAPKLARFALCNMFSACTHPDVKDEVLKSFCNPNGILRIVVATIAFGMGLECPNVSRIIHWGPPSDVESYLQETGRPVAMERKQLLLYTSQIWSSHQ